MESRGRRLVRADARGGEGVLITLVVNGKEETLQGPMTVRQYLAAKGITQRFIAVAHNGRVLRKDEYDDVLLANGDRVEIVRPVGGG